MTDLAKHVRIVRTGDEYEFTVDGKPFPWHVSADGFTVGTVSRDNLPCVTVTLLTESIDVVHNINRTKGDQ